MTRKIFFLLVLVAMSSFSQNLLNNGGLENWPSTTTPDDWIVNNPDIIQELTEVNQGSSSAKLIPVTDPIFFSETASFSQEFILEDTEEYLLSFDYLVPGTSISDNSVNLISYSLENLTPNNAFFFTQGEALFDGDFVRGTWTRVEYVVQVLAFRNGATSTDINLTLRANAFANTGTQEAFIDNVSVSRIIPANDREALIALYNATDGDNWINSWDLTADESTWQGVTLNNEGRVIGLNLFNNNLSGELPEEIWDLTMLESLRLDFNPDLIGVLSPNIANLMNLRDLNLSQNGLNGPFPPEIFSILALESIQFSDQFEGSLEGIGNLTNLNVFISSGSSFDFIPENFWSLPNLRLVNITSPFSNQNQITYAIPTTINQLSSLESLIIRGTNTIPIPNEITQLPNLFTLSLNGILTGEIPENIGDLTSLSTLILSGGLEGEIPVEIQNLENLSRLSLVNNNLTGEIPSEIGNITTLESLNLSLNNFSGPIPSSIGQLTNLTVLFIVNAGISGNIPEEIVNCVLLQAIDIKDNNLEGDITSLINLPSITQLDISNNQFSGTIPANITETSWSILNLTNNNLSGPIPDLTANSTLFSFQIEDNNFVFDDFEDEFAQYQTNITFFNFFPQSNVDVEETIILNQGEDITLSVEATQSPNNSYQWRKDGVNIDGATERTLTLADATGADIGEYDCVITNNVVTDLTLVRNTITLSVTLGTEDFSTAGITAYPIPAQNELVLSLGSISGEEIDAAIYGVTGNLIFQQKNIVDNQALDMSNISTGIYILRLSSSSRTYTARITKK